MKEAVKIMYDGEWYIATPVNISGVCVQGKTIDEVKTKIKYFIQTWLNMFQEVIDKDGFEFYEVEHIAKDLDIRVNKRIE